MDDEGLGLSSQHLREEFNKVTASWITLASRSLSARICFPCARLSALRRNLRLIEEMLEASCPVGMRPIESGNLTFWLILQVFSNNWPRTP